MAVSDRVKTGPEKAPHRSLWKALGLTDEELTRFIQHDARLWLDMGSIFGKEGEGFIRLNVACPRSVVKEALERLEAAANGLSR